LSLPAVTIVVYLAASDGRPVGEGVFAVVFLVLATVGLQTVLALGCLVAAAVVYRGDPGLGQGLVTGWVIGVGAVGTGGVVCGYLWNLAS
jgi:hypothetical protein